MKGPGVTRHSVRVKTSLCLPLLFASYTLADESADRAAIGRVIAGLNELPRRAALFTEDSDALTELGRLPKVAPVEYRVRRPGGADRPTVTISHEPWGEAAIDFPGMPTSVESVNPRIVSNAIRVLTPDVALADGAWTYKARDGTTQTIPLLFVMKKEGDDWKIAALRILPPR